MPKSKNRRKQASATAGRLPDRRALEAVLAAFGGGGEDSGIEAAQRIMWDAWDEVDRRKRVALAREALKVSPLCADAYVMLALETARTPDEALALYRQGVEASEKGLGKSAFEEDVGHFWGILETRPYMRARHGLAQALWKTGRRDEAVSHYQDMLRLNPNDNQGIRYLLLDCLLELGRDGEASRLLERYKEDASAAWTWSRALLRFKREGDSPASRKALAGAVKDNGHVAAYLLGRKKMPRNLPEYIGMGDDNEAVAYVHGAAGAWNATDGALAWLGTRQA